MVSLTCTASRDHFCILAFEIVRPVFSSANSWCFTYSRFDPSELTDGAVKWLCWLWYWSLELRILIGWCFWKQVFFLDKRGYGLCGYGINQPFRRNVAYILFITNAIYFTNMSFCTTPLRWLY